MASSAALGDAMHSVELSFPVATTTTMPASTAALTNSDDAPSPVLVPLPPAHSVEPRDMLTTSMPCQMLPGVRPGQRVFLLAIHHSRPRLLPPTLAPASESTLQSTSRAPGATPAK